MDNLPRYLTELQVSALTNISLSTLRNNRSLRRGIAYTNYMSHGVHRPLIYLYETH